MREKETNANFDLKQNGKLNRIVISYIVLYLNYQLSWLSQILGNATSLCNREMEDLFVPFVIMSSIRDEDDAY